VKKRLDSYWFFFVALSEDWGWIMMGW